MGEELFKTIKGVDEAGANDFIAKREAGSCFNLGLAFKEIQQKTDALKAFYKARQLFQSIELNNWMQRCDNEINSLTSLANAP